MGKSFSLQKSNLQNLQKELDRPQNKNKRVAYRGNQVILYEKGELPKGFKKASPGKILKEIKKEKKLHPDSDFSKLKGRILKLKEESRSTRAKRKMQGVASKVFYKDEDKVVQKKKTAEGQDIKAEQKYKQYNAMPLWKRKVGGKKLFDEALKSWKGTDGSSADYCPLIFADSKYVTEDLILNALDARPELFGHLEKIEEGLIEKIADKDSKYPINHAVKLCQKQSDDPFRLCTTKEQKLQAVKKLGTPTSINHALKNLSKEEIEELEDDFFFKAFENWFSISEVNESYSFPACPLIHFPERLKSAEENEEMNEIYKKIEEAVDAYNSKNHEQKSSLPDQTKPVYWSEKKMLDNLGEVADAVKTDSKVFDQLPKAVQENVRKELVPEFFEEFGEIPSIEQALKTLHAQTRPLVIVINSAPGQEASDFIKDKVEKMKALAEEGEVADVLEMAHELALDHPEYKYTDWLSKLEAKVVEQKAIPVQRRSETTKNPVRGNGTAKTYLGQPWGGARGRNNDKVVLTKYGTGCLDGTGHNKNEGMKPAKGAELARHLEEGINKIYKENPNISDEDLKDKMEELINELNEAAENKSIPMTLSLTLLAPSGKVLCINIGDSEIWSKSPNGEVKKVSEGYDGDELGNQYKNSFFEFVECEPGTTFITFTDGIDDLLSQETFPPLNVEDVIRGEFEGDPGDRLMAFHMESYRKKLYEDERFKEYKEEGLKLKEAVINALQGIETKQQAIEKLEPLKEDLGLKGSETFVALIIGYLDQYPALDLMSAITLAEKEYPIKKVSRDKWDDFSLTTFQVGQENNSLQLDEESLAESERKTSTKQKLAKGIEKVVKPFRKKIIGLEAESHRQLMKTNPLYKDVVVLEKRTKANKENYEQLANEKSTARLKDYAPQSKLQPQESPKGKDLWDQAEIKAEENARAEREEVDLDQLMRLEVYKGLETEAEKLDYLLKSPNPEQLIKKIGDEKLKLKLTYWREIESKPDFIAFAPKEIKNDGPFLKACYSKVGEAGREMFINSLDVEQLRYLKTQLETDKINPPDELYVAMVVKRPNLAKDSLPEQMQSNEAFLVKAFQAVPERQRQAFFDALPDNVKDKMFLALSQTEVDISDLEYDIG